jgi:hypothetical protein
VLLKTDSNCRISRFRCRSSSAGVMSQFTTLAGQQKALRD